MCISWTIKCLILLMPRVIKKFTHKIHLKSDANPNTAVCCNQTHNRAAYGYKRSELTTDDDRVCHYKYMVHILLQLLQIRTIRRHCCRRNALPLTRYLKQQTECWNNNASSLLVELITHSCLFQPTFPTATRGLQERELFYSFEFPPLVSTYLRVRYLRVN